MSVGRCSDARERDVQKGGCVVDIRDETGVLLAIRDCLNGKMTVESPRSFNQVRLAGLQDNLTVFEKRNT